MLLPLILLVVALIGTAVLVRRDVDSYRRFKLIDDTIARQRQFRQWIAVTFVLFAGYAVITLALLSRLDALARMPAEFTPVASVFGDGLGLSGARLGGMAIGMAIGGGGAALFTILRKARSDAAAAPRTAGDYAALLPRNRAELLHAAALSVNAGLTEELFFRLALPLLFVVVTGNPWIAFGCAGIVFGLAHLYQGAIGVVATTALGLLLTLAYLASGSIWVAVMLHILIDLVSLVLRPMLSGVGLRADPAA